MNDDGEDSVAVGAEEARRAAVLRPLVQAYLNGSGSLERGINDAVWELGVSRATVWRWIKRLAEEGGRTSALAPRKRGRPTGTMLISSKVEAVIEEQKVKSLKQVLALTGGVTSRIFALVKDLSIDAIITGEECITDDTIAKWTPVWSRHANPHRRLQKSRV